LTGPKAPGKNRPRANAPGKKNSKPPGPKAPGKNRPGASAPRGKKVTNYSQNRILFIRTAFG